MAVDDMLLKLAFPDCAECLPIHGASLGDKKQQQTTNSAWICVGLSLLLGGSFGVAPALVAANKTSQWPPCERRYVTNCGHGIKFVAASRFLSVDQVGRLSLVLTVVGRVFSPQPD